MTRTHTPSHVVLYTDGGSRGNPGPAAIGVHIETLGKKYGEVIGVATNNDAEYQALIFSLQKLKQLVGKKTAENVTVECRMDSELIVRQLQHKYKILDPKIQKNFLTVWNLMLDFSSVTFVHVPREQNTVADAMVNHALDEAQKQSSLALR